MRRATRPCGRKGRPSPCPEGGFRLPPSPEQGPGSLQSLPAPGLSRTSPRSPSNTRGKRSPGSVYPGTHGARPTPARSHSPPFYPGQLSARLPPWSLIGSAVPGSTPVQSGLPAQRSRRSCARVAVGSGRRQDWARGCPDSRESVRPRPERRSGSVRVHCRGYRRWRVRPFVRQE